MKYKLYLILLIMLIQKTQAQNFIIPAPVSYEKTNLVFAVKDKINLDIQTEDKQVKKYVEQFELFLAEKGIRANTQQGTKQIIKDKKITIRLLQKPSIELGEEGYLLEVNTNDIKLSANKSSGIFNGFQTLQQLFPAEVASGKTQQDELIKIEGCKIKDYPRFKWRGLMLDVSRHFFSVEEVKAYIDQMVKYKFNVFHWHLTDDNGWRIEIKSFPKLTEVGAWRVERNGKFGSERSDPQESEPTTYGGFYTQEQIKDIVAYATDRNVTIVPEIDMPGHSMAALTAYPELSTTKEQSFVNPGTKFAEWFENGKFKMFIDNTLNPTDEKVYDFIDKVFTEISELFPSKYIHMGGDEAYHGFWERDSLVQKFMKKNSIKDSHELQSYFVKRVGNIIRSKGKKMIGWDEILEGDLSNESAIMSWRGMEGGIKATKSGHKVVMSPTTYAYLDYMQGDKSVENKIYASLSLEKSYNFEPAPEGVNAENILGGQANLWTEEIPNLQFAFYMTYPRAFAISEALWNSKEKKDWDSFIARTENHFERFKNSNKNICKAVYDPIVTVSKDDNKLMCSLKNSIPNTEIYYTIDNTYPVKFGKKYIGTFEIPEGDLSLRTQTFRDGKPIGRELLIHRTALEKRVKK